MGRLKSTVPVPYKINSIAAHVPDLVVYADLSREIPYVENFHGVLLFVDISGFTALTEKFSVSSKKGYGADQLTRTLNKYIGDIVHYILTSGGDILNYAGDAILALWRVERIQLSNMISLAVKCSLNIQNNCGNRETEVGVKLRVKIGISAGKISKVVMGGKDSKYFVVIGRAVDEVRLAEGLAVAHSIILSPNAWEMCDRDTIATDPIENERAVKVRYLKRESFFSVETYLESLGTPLQHEPSKNVSVRKTSRLLPDSELEKNLREFVMQTILQKIDDDQPLEYLSEMRPVTIVFVNLQFKMGTTETELCLIMQNAALGIGQLIRKHQGRINKVFMFDKGCTFLCVFGLPGDKREDECAHALLCAYTIHEYCSKELKVSTASVGVTSGPVFCGVVGHPMRHEYTVIGRKVNMAARLMMYYPGVVSCDKETCVHSKLPSFYFNELPKRPMKGVQNPGTIYQYLARKHQKTVGKAQMSMERVEGYHLLGRDKEIDVFNTALKQFLECRSSGSRNYKNVIMYEGDVGFGKSSVLAEIVYRAAKEGVRVIAFEIAKSDIKQQFYTVQTLLAIVLSVQNCKSYAERERLLLSKITDQKQQEKLCLLNDLLLVKFPVSKKVSLLDNKTKIQEMKTFFIDICKNALEVEACLFVFDQAHYIDFSSWELIVELCEKTSAFMIMALRPFNLQNPPFPSAAKVMRNPNTLYVKLSVLEPSVIAQLACQILGVIRIPREMELLLVERSHGVPYYCEELLKSLYLSKMIVLEQLDDEDEEDVDILFSEPKIVIENPKASQICKPEDGKQCNHSKTEPLRTRMIKSLDMSSLEDQKYVCFIGEAVTLHEIQIPLTLKGMYYYFLDHLQPAEQMIVKFASIIGYTFTTQMLQYILIEGADQKLNQSLDSLFESHTFECASRRKETWHPFIMEKKHENTLQCFCTTTEQESIKLDDTESEVTDKATRKNQTVWKCKIMRFCSSLVMETAYELWLKDQKKAIHLKCATYLLNQARRCRTCGGDEFILGHSAAIGMKVLENNPDNVNNQLENVADIFGSSSSSYGKFRTRINKVAPIDNSRFEGSFLIKLDDILAGSEQVAQTCRKCKCADIVECVLCPMVRHCMGVGDVPKTFYFLLETAAAATILSNNLKALSYLNEATIILDLLRAGKPPFETAETKGKVKIRSFEKACAFRLKGEVLFNTGQIKEAQDMFRMALKLLKRRLPMNVIEVLVKYMVEKAKYSLHGSKKTVLMEKRLAFLHQQICCLSYMWQIYCMNRSPGYKMTSSLVILMEVNTAKLCLDQNKIISAHIDSFHYCQIVGLVDECKRYEELLIKTCAELPYTAERLMMVGNFAHTLSTVRLCSGKLDESIQYGYRAHKFAELLNKPSFDVIAISLMLIPLLLTHRYADCVELLCILEYLVNTLQNSIGKGWFYAACFDILLQGGKYFDECLSFVEEAQSDPIIMAEKSLMLNLYASLALWFARLNEWDQSRYFFVKALRIVDQAPSSVYSINGHVKFLECYVLVFRKALVDKNNHTVEIYNRTQKHFSDFKSRYATFLQYDPRFLHLKAYMYLISGQQKLVKSFLQKALKISQNHGNKLEECWIRLSEDSWFGTTEPPADQWLEIILNLPSWETAAQMDVNLLSKSKYLLPGFRDSYNAC
ncbi:adenylate cyclase type 10-like [Huso huso]|uniref:Adenylate cyclase type 10-like n=1 Tax=Huso huso TaxID=61971 RepID=A0ABR0ZE55_HUSHU